MDDNVIIFANENLISAASTLHQVIVDFSERPEEALGKVARAYDGALDRSDGDIQEVMSVCPRDDGGILRMILSE